MKRKMPFLSIVLTALTVILPSIGSTAEITCVANVKGYLFEKVKTQVNLRIQLNGNAKVGDRVKSIQFSTTSPSAFIDMNKMPFIEINSPIGLAQIKNSSVQSRIHLSPAAKFQNYVDKGVYLDFWDTDKNAKIEPERGMYVTLLMLSDNWLSSGGYPFPATIVLAELTDMVSAAHTIVGECRLLK